MKYAEAAPLVVNVLTGQVMAWLAGFVMLNTRLASVCTVFFVAVQSCLYNLDQVQDLTNILNLNDDHMRLYKGKLQGWKIKMGRERVCSLEFHFFVALLAIVLTGY